MGEASPDPINPQLGEPTGVLAAPTYYPLTNSLTPTCDGVLLLPHTSSSSTR